MANPHDASGPVAASSGVDLRGVAREIFLHALQESSIRKAFDRYVQLDRGILRIGEDLLDLGSFSRIFVVAIGKAAHTMVESLMTQLGAGVTGIVAASTDPATQVFGFRYYRGGHPIPNSDSVKAAEAILKALATHASRSLVIYLISGGASAIVEKPVDDSITLEDLIATYKALVHSGAPIREINAVRKHLSATKGGRLAKVASPAQQVSILVSDVPDGASDALASGPTMPDTTSVEECYEIVRRHKLLKQFPASVRTFFERGELEETPKHGDQAFDRSRYWTVLSNEVARKNAVTKAVMNGFAVEVDNSCDDWDYAAAADHLLKRLRDLRKGVSRVCLISGGEVTVKVTGDAGIGGRNQQFALYCASKIAGEQITVLSAGTDGIDGNSQAAGAVVDGRTMKRAEELGVDVAKSLKSFDAFPVLNALGDTIVTGPTGNNIRDLRILLAY
jgi:hydroxypyruvate reductase